MPAVDWPRAQLESYRPPQSKQPDFSEFWRRTLDAHQHPFDAIEEHVDYPAAGITVSKVTFRGYGQGRVAGWLLVPDSASKLPGMVMFHGYTGNRGAIFDAAAWALHGFVTLAIDVRGQTGESTHPDADPSGHAPGWMTEGIRSPETYYYRAVYVDCVRSVQFLQAHSRVDAKRVGCTGASQGGGLTLATAALEPSVALAMAEVPYLCDFPRAVEVANIPGGRITYAEIAAYCRAYPDRYDEAFRTLTYFDVVNLADRIACPTLVCVGLWDPICPPSTVYAAFNHLKAEPRLLDVFPYLDHAVTSTHRDEKVRWAARHLQS